MWTSFEGLNAPTTPPEHEFTLHTDRLLRIALSDSRAWSKHGAMVAYTGAVEFDYQGSGSVGRFMKKALTGEGQRLMTFHGRGEVFAADQNRHIFLVYLQGEGLTVNGPSLLAFSSGIEWDIVRVHGLGGMASAGLFNTQLQGTGWVALTAHGKPILFDVQAQPLTVDPQAAVAWASTVTTEMRTNLKLGSLVGRGRSGPRRSPATSPPAG